jgi:hypothetical protein
MSDQESKQRDRSPNYPYLTLPNALARAHQFYGHEKRGSAAIPVVAKHWDYSAKSSGLIQSIAALKSYGLMDEEGRGADRRVKLSELALRILLDQRPDSPERDECMQRAARMPAIAQRILEKFPDDVPSEHNLEHFLIFDLKFNPESAKAAVRGFIENADFSGLYRSGSISASTVRTGEPVKEAVSPSVGQFAVKSPSSTYAAVERIIGPTGEIVVQFSGDASLEAYQFLEDYIKLRKSVLKPGAASGKASEAEEEKEGKAALRRTA